MVQDRRNPCSISSVTTLGDQGGVCLLAYRFVTLSTKSKAQLADLEEV